MLVDIQEWGGDRVGLGDVSSCLYNWKYGLA